MLELYRDKQEIAYNIMMNEIKNHTLSHAYLFDENNNSEALQIIKEFVKEIFCEDNKGILSSDELDVLCKRINDDNYPELKIITADGLYIKKGQILDLQKEFSRVSLEGKRRIYIIRECEKMRAEAANSMLKFLEEPDNCVIAIMTTNNYNSVLNTIISRCQLIRLVKDNINSFDEENDECVWEFINCLENRGLKTVLNINEIWTDKSFFKDREKINLLIDKMIDVYYNILKFKKGIIMDWNLDYKDKLSNISSLNDENMLCRKIEYLLQVKKSIKYNINCSLLIDAIIVNIGGISDEGSWN